ncbi:DNA primase family protein [Oscillibacter ruminantium]|uniref:DNA primase family protein n=1 Tax=Oscillibacter ruminantium TaxID=1263547 RepID=UPI0002FC21F8|nr:DUF5906 domain-containing protein [Oscillibacter ruminantium]
MKSFDFEASSTDCSESFDEAAFRSCAFSPVQGCERESDGDPPPTLGKYFGEDIWDGPGFSEIDAEPVEEMVDLRAFMEGDTLCTYYGGIEQGMPQPQQCDLPKMLSVAFADCVQPSIDLKAVQKNQTGVFVAQVARRIASQGDFALINKNLCYYNGIHWVILSREEAEAEVKNWVKLHLENVDMAPRLIREIVAALRTDKSIHIDNRSFQSKDYLINCNDGIYDALNGTVYPHSSQYDFFGFIDIPVGSIGCGPHRYFDSYVKNAFGGQTEAYWATMEMSGAIIANIYMKKIFFLYGASNTGKSQWGLFLQKLLGESLTTAVSSVSDFSGEWTTGTLMDKRLCLCLDLPDEDLSPKTISVLKQLSGDDPILGNRKYQNPFTFKSQTVMVFATNHKIKIPDIYNQEALLKRITPIPFFRAIPEQEQIPHLAELMYEQEAPYIVGKLVDAVQALKRRNNQLTVAMELDDVIFNPDEDAGRDEDKSIAEFVRKCCVLNPSSVTITENLYVEYCGFCEAKGLTSCTKINFARRLIHNFKQLIPVKRVQGQDHRGIQGIGFATGRVRLENTE